MSISPTVGAHRWLFSRAITARAPNLARQRFKSLHQQGYVPETVYKMFDRAQTAAQGFFSGPAMLFESFRFRYIGPINGHSVADLVEALEHAKAQEVPVLVHARTSKGQGFPLAEEDPIKWHSVKPFDRNNGKFHPPKTDTTKLPPTYTKVFSETLLKLAERDDRVVTITAAMAEGTGLDLIRKELPRAFFDVGISEQHAVTFAAGLSCEGYRPVCAIYSTFLQRAYDQVIHDVCIQELPVLFAIDRAGVVGNDGETHQGQFDLTYLRTVPKLTIMVPANERELQEMLVTGLQLNGPSAIRYPRGNAVGTDLAEDPQPINIGQGQVWSEGKDILFLAVGPLIYQAKEAADELQARLNLTSTITNMRFVKPLDESLLKQELSKPYKLVCTIEDHALAGGFGSAILEFINDNHLSINSPVLRFGLRDEFISHASQQQQLTEHCCLAKQIVEKVAERLY